VTYVTHAQRLVALEGAGALKTLDAQTHTRKALRGT